MSLNGLDAQPLSEAYEAAQKEPGGWFWIKYATRDDAELLLRGSNGAEEMREVAAKEPEDSPLYGYIRFRRRNVLVKYIPEGTSRVLKARSQVHFQLVIDKFSPHDTTFAISSPKQLTDSGLTSACSTHTVSASVSSSNSSLRQRRLEDIAESADEEEPAASPRSTIQSVPTPVTFGETDDKGKNQGQGLAVVVTTHGNTVSEAADYRDEADRDVSSLPLRGDHNLEPPRKSTSSTLRPSTDLSYHYTPKVKLGPRPHVETPKRPHSSNERSKSFQTSEELRASVPRSVHLPPKRSSTTPNSRTKSLSSVPIPELFIPQPPPSPALSVRSTDAPPTLSPEKQRLMRALQLRRQTMVEQKKEQDQIDDNASISSAEGATAVVQSTAPEKESRVDDFEHEAADSNEDGSVDEPLQLRKEGLSVQSSPPSVSPVQENHIVLNIPVAPKEGVAGSQAVDTDAETNDQMEVRNIKPQETMEKAVVVEEAEEAKEEEEAPPTPASLDTDKDEGKKVRDDIGSESDATSVKSLDVDSEKSEATATLPVEPAEVPDISNSLENIVQPAAPSSPGQQKPPLPPKVLKRFERHDSLPPNETPVIETARSVSAPFLQTARDTKPAVPRKVNVSSSSVSQRIKQFQMLAVKNVQGTATPPPTRSPSISRSNSPTPEFLTRPLSSGKATLESLNRPVSAGKASPAEKPTPLPVRQTSAPKAQAILSESPAPQPKVASPPRVEIIEKDNKPQLQVTTTINREETKQESPSAESSPKSNDPFVGTAPRRKSMDMSSVIDFVSPRRSIDTSPSGRRSSADKERPRLFSRSSGSRSDLEDLPEGSVSLASSARRGSASSLKEKSPKSATSAKGSGLLKRMSSSLSWKKDTPPESTSVVGDEPVKKTYLLAGWVNVQLPDTMLWRRRCMKVDSEGLLFLSVSEDETAPQTRRYHLPSDIRKVDLPDLDEQELPNSVRLYLNEGGMLQCACQNRAEQKEILGVIRDFLAP